MKTEDIQSKNFAGIYREPLYPLKRVIRGIFQTILIECNHSDNPNFVFENQIYPLKRGQWVVSKNTLSELTGYSVQQIKTALKNLQNLKILTYESTGILANHATLITITDIDKWLVKPKVLTNGTTTKVTNPQPTVNQPLTTNNNDTNNDTKNESTKNEIPKTSNKEILPPAVKKISEEKKVPEKSGLKTIEEIMFELKKIPRENMPKNYWQSIALECVEKLHIHSDNHSVIFGYFKKNLYLCEAIYRYMLESTKPIDNKTGYFLSEYKRRKDL